MTGGAVYTSSAVRLSSDEADDSFFPPLPFPLNMSSGSKSSVCQSTACGTIVNHSLSSSTIARLLPRAFRLGLGGVASSLLESTIGTAPFRAGFELVGRLKGSGRGLGPLALESGEGARAGEPDIFGGAKCSGDGVRDRSWCGYLGSGSEFSRCLASGNRACGAGDGDRDPEPRATPATGARRS